MGYSTTVNLRVKARSLIERLINTICDAASHASNPLDVPQDICQMGQNLYLGTLQVALTRPPSTCPLVDIIINCVRSNSECTQSLAVEPQAHDPAFTFTHRDYFADALATQGCKCINIYSSERANVSVSVMSSFLDAEEGSAEWLASSPLTALIQEAPSQNILVASCTGTNRACSLIAAHLLRVRRSKLLSTLLFIADRWGPILTLSKYRRGLMQFALANNLVESTPEEVSRIVHLTAFYPPIVYGQPWSEPLSDELFQDDAEYDEYVEEKGGSIKQLPEGHPQRLQEQKIHMISMRRRRLLEKSSVNSSDCGASDGDDLLVDLVPV